MTELTPLGRVHLLTNYLINERGSKEFLPEATTFEDAFEVFRALVNVRDPKPIPQEFLNEQDIMLQGMLRLEGVTRAVDLEPCPNDPKIRLWRGDITTLEADGIVNAANSQLLGCFVPQHYCIDNAIHTFAGVQLRLECHDIMQQQGFPEPTGKAKVTSAYNLPSTYVIHTVGPIANGNPTPGHRKDLTNCYTSCLDAAAYHDMRSVAFCCISTGVFGFPQREAAHIAVEAVRAWLAAHEKADIVVVFNVYTEQDYAIYQDILGA
ncbi:MAG: protein-ADP-ribose hydrolase [Coriobacteriia bacterium]|nr:protein-ADP-ribose hydrolase [Coriobacteriia bacterium]